MTATASYAKKALGILGLLIALGAATDSAALTARVALGTNLGTLEPAPVATTNLKVRDPNGTDGPVIGPIDPGPVAIASIMGGGEWAFDAPWRLEPPYAKLPINLSFHDVADPKDPYDTSAFTPYDGSTPTIEHICDLFVVISRADGAALPAHLRTYHWFPLASIGKHPHWYSGFEESIAGKFHEIERSAKWPASSDGPAFHTVRRVWRGETITADDVRISDTAEWQATALIDVSGFPSGDYLVTAVAYTGCSDLAYFDEYHGQWVPDLPLEEQLRGRQGLHPPTYASELGMEFANTFRVHFAQKPLPRFDGGWVYGDIHYHSQGTDNEGESGYNYRAVIQAMRAMGLDFIVASDHASSSDQVTDIDTLFVDNLPDDLPYLPDWDWIREKILDALEGKGPPIETSIDAARDMNPRRWKYLHHWLNGPDGVNRQVLSGNSRGRFGLLDSLAISDLTYATVATDLTHGSTTSSVVYGPRTPQIILGGEVDAIPEMSLEEGTTQLLRYGNDKLYRWGDACVEVPDELMDLANYTTLDICAHRSDLLELASTGDSYLLHDIQGLGSNAYFARQHFIHIPADPTRDDAFVASETSHYGGGHRRLADILADDYAIEQKGYLFLAHPVSAASGNGFSRLGPDIVPYSESQLMKAFRAPQFLGLQLWNEDSRMIADPSKGGRTWDAKKENGQLSALHHGAATWDRMLLWSMNPARTAGISWLPPNTPRPVFMAGGSDAHGDLNFRREGSITGWSESTDTALGKPRNLVFVGPDRLQAVDNGTAVSHGQIVDGFRTGNFAVTDGPALRTAIDRNGNNAIDAGDTPMGGIADLSSVPLLVEWKSTPEFGPVTSIDLYVGAQAGTLDGAVWAPSAHGARGANDRSGVQFMEIPHSSGRIFKQLDDNYFLDPNGRLRITVPAAEGMGGVRKVVLNRADYPIVQKACHEETSNSPPTCWTDYKGMKHCSKPIITTKTVCTATSVTSAERIYVRAFARTASAAPLGTGSVALQRFAYTNPIWVRPVFSPLGNIAVKGVLALR